jgi:hypothetical protein
MRHDYTFVLEITPTQPLTHGAGNLGNEQQLCRREAVYYDADAGEYLEVSYPCISGSAFKATLREAAVADYLESLGIPDGSLSLDVVRLLLKGGKTTSAGQTVSLDDLRRMGALIPPLDVFGSMDGGCPRPSRVRVSEVRPYSEGLARAGLIPRVVAPLRALSADDDSATGIAVYPGQPPVPDEMIETRIEYFSHDVRGRATGQRFIAGADAKALEDRGALVARRAGGEKPSKEERRDAWESMPHSYQAIRPGCPMVAVIRLDGASEIDALCLTRAITRWIAQGARLGGATGSKGHGACTVALAGALRHRPEPGALETQPIADVLAVGEPQTDAARESYRRYDAYLAEHRAAILAELGVSG